MKNPLKKNLVLGKRRDLKEFESLALPIMHQLYSSALRLTRVPADAEDLLQETYFKAWRAFHRFERGSNLIAWMMRIMMNIHISAFHRKKRSPLKADFETTCKTFADEYRQETDMYDVRDPEFSHNDIFDDDIADALDRLPEQFRRVILLADVNDFQYKEIAKILNCPIGSVMSRLHRARRMMAKSLKGYAEVNGYVVRALAA